MIGVVEYHGANQVLHVLEESYSLPLSSTRFVPGDRVSVGDPVLHARTPQPICAILQSLVPLRYHIANLPPVCPFQPTLVVSPPPAVGERLILWLDAVGGERVLDRFTADPKEDVACLLAMYTGAENDGPRPVEATTPRTPGLPRLPRLSLYTRPEVVDHSDLDTFTIDPTDSKDFDDALSVDAEHGIVYVHIVDMAHATLTEDETRRLRERCLTLYLANEHVEHLLDAETASDRLSLVVGVPRETVTVKLTLTEGLVSAYEVYRSTIVVKRRWSYEEVASLIATGSASEAIRYLHRLAIQRSASVNYTLSLPSVRLTIDHSTGLALAFSEGVRLEDTQDAAHQLVATAMILANLTVSKHLATSGVDLPNRFHASLRGMLRADGSIATGNAAVDSFIRVKQYARARYAVDEKGHFGLGLTDYVHFTSPMRRYADVVVHRLLAGLPVDDLEGQVQRMNHQARLVNTLQDLYERWKITRHLATLTDCPPVYITSVHRAGVQWFMPSLSLNGFSHVSTLDPSQFWALRSFAVQPEYLQGSVEAVRVGEAFHAVVAGVDTITCAVRLRIQTNRPFTPAPT